MIDKTIERYLRNLPTERAVRLGTLYLMYKSSNNPWLHKTGSRLWCLGVDYKKLIHQREMDRIITRFVNSESSQMYRESDYHYRIWSTFKVMEQMAKKPIIP